jgi:hypothetical protein
MPERDPPTSATSDRPGALDARRALRVVGMTLVLSWTAFVTLEAIPIQAGEPVLLAWARLAVEHPVRLGLAVGLLLAACGGRGGGLPPGKDPPSELSSQGP